jgi:hypothetical protein
MLLSGIRSFFASIIIGVVFIAGGFFTLFMVNTDAGNYAKLEKDGIKVAGKIVDVSYNTETTGTGSSRKTRTYEAVRISYDVEGKTYTLLKKEQKSSGSGKVVGSTVNLLAEKGNPSHAEVERVDGQGNNTGLGRIIAIAFIFFGFVALANSGVAFFRGLVFGP